METSETLEATYVSLARENANDGLEIDDQPAVSIGEEGAWVSAWFWVEKPDKTAP